MSFEAYADCEFDILKARIHGQLTEDEYTHARMMAYLVYGYTAPARRAKARRLRAAA